QAGSTGSFESIAFLTFFQFGESAFAQSNPKVGQTIGFWDSSATAAASSRFTAVEDTQHHDPMAVVAILEHVRGAEHFQDELPVLPGSRERPDKFRRSRENLRSGNDLLRNDGGKLWRLLMKKRRESIEVGEGVVRPFELY